MSGDVEMVVLTAAFDARPDREAELAAVLARYVVLTRGEAALPQRRPAHISHPEWPFRGHREVGLGRVGAGASRHRRS